MVTMIGIAVAWLIQGVKDIALWAPWFAAFNLLIGIYAKANVDQKKVLLNSPNYDPELAEK